MKETFTRRQEQTVLTLAKAVSLLRARDLATHGIPTAVLSRLVAAGKLERTARGIYSLPTYRASEHQSLAELALRAPGAVVCLLSALSVHGIGTQMPFQVWLAIPNNAAAPKLAYPPIRPIRMSGPALTEGIEIKTFDGVGVKIFSAAKTVADCFKFRNKIGLDVALEALQEGVRLRKFSNDELWRHAEINRVTRVIRPYMEMLLQ